MGCTRGFYQMPLFFPGFQDQNSAERLVFAAICGRFDDGRQRLRSTSGALQALEQANGYPARCVLGRNWI